MDVANATWTNTIGAPELIAFWKDPAFNAAERAFYYVRVLEIPTPRWTAYDAKRYGTTPLPGHAHDHRRARVHLADLVLAELTMPGEGGTTRGDGRGESPPVAVSGHGWLRGLLREPLLHFLVLGLALFLLYNAISGSRGGGDRRIVVNDATVATIVRLHQSTWKRTPTPAELKGLIDAHVRDEVLFREGAAMGLDRDDAVIRRRVQQKLVVIAEESDARAAPTDAELQAYLGKHADRYARPAIVGFDQVMFDPMRHGASLRCRRRRRARATACRREAGRRWATARCCRSPPTPSPRTFSRGTTAKHSRRR